MIAQGTSCSQLVRLFLRLGFVSFGGPAAHIANMHAECVVKRRWLTPVEFLDLLAATNMIPGPNSTEMAIHIGYKRAGLPGLIAAGVAFILPAALIVGMIAHFYVGYGVLPQAGGVLYAIKPAVIAIILAAVTELGRTAVRSTFLGFLGIAAVVANAAGISELLVLFGAAAVGYLSKRPARRAALFMIPAAALPTTLGMVGLGSVFLYFLKTGSIIFGSGYVLVAFLQADLVNMFGWLTSRQLLDAVAVSQLTPGPLFTVATFIGYVLAGFPGAVVATLGIFMPAFVLVGVTQPFLVRLSQMPGARAALDGVNVAAVALMLVVTWQLGRAAIVDVPTAAIALAAAFLIGRFRMNSAFIVLGAAVAGLLMPYAR
jgi:chromate transporter